MYIYKSKAISTMVQVARTNNITIQREIDVRRSARGMYSYVDFLTMSSIS